MQDLRKWLKRIDEIGQLKQLDGVDWNLEMGVLTEENTLRKGPALLFDRIPGLTPGFRVLTNILATPERVSTSLNFPIVFHQEADLVQDLIGKPEVWEKDSPSFPVKIVGNGPIMENILIEKDVDLYRIPSHFTTRGLSLMPASLMREGGPFP